MVSQKKAAQVSPGPAVAPKPADQTPLERRPWPKSLAAVRMPLSGEMLIRYESRAPQDGRSVVRRRCKTVKKRDEKEAVLDMRHNSV